MCLSTPKVEVPAPPPPPPPPPPEAEPNVSPRAPVDARDEKEQVLKKAQGKRSLRIDLNVPRSSETGLNIPL